MLKEEPEAAVAGTAAPTDTAAPADGDADADAGLPSPPVVVETIRGPHPDVASMPPHDPRPLFLRHVSHSRPDMRSSTRALSRAPSLPHLLSYDVRHDDIKAMLEQAVAIMQTLKTKPATDRPADKPAEATEEVAHDGAAGEAADHETIRTDGDSASRQLLQEAGVRAQRSRYSFVADTVAEDPEQEMSMLPVDADRLGENVADEVPVDAQEPVQPAPGEAATRPAHPGELRSPSNIPRPSEVVSFAPSVSPSAEASITAVDTSAPASTTAVDDSPITASSIPAPAAKSTATPQRHHKRRDSMRRNVAGLFRGTSSRSRKEKEAAGKEKEENELPKEKEATPSTATADAVSPRAELTPPPTPPPRNRERRKSIMGFNSSDLVHLLAPHAKDKDKDKGKGKEAVETSRGAEKAEDSNNKTLQKRASVISVASSARALPVAVAAPAVESAAPTSVAEVPPEPTPTPAQPFDDGLYHPDPHYDDGQYRPPTNIDDGQYKLDPDAAPSLSFSGEETLATPLSPPPPPHSAPPALPATTPAESFVPEAAVADSAPTEAQVSAQAGADADAEGNSAVPPPTATPASATSTPVAPRSRRNSLASSLRSATGPLLHRRESLISVAESALEPDHNGVKPAFPAPSTPTTPQRPSTSSGLLGLARRSTTTVISGGERAARPRSGFWGGGRSVTTGGTGTDGSTTSLRFEEGLGAKDGSKDKDKDAKPRFGPFRRRGSVGALTALSAAEARDAVLGAGKENGAGGKEKTGLRGRVKTILGRKEGGAAKHREKEKEKGRESPAAAATPPATAA